MRNRLNLRKARAVMVTHANIWTLLLILLAFYLINPNFLNPFNMKNLLTNMAPLLVMACGATYVRLLGSLDLSMGAVASCANVMLVKLLPVLGAASFAVVLAFGLFAGFLLGMIHTKLKIPSFIASLGMMNVYNSVALLITAKPENIAKAEKIYISWARTSWGVISVSTIIAVSIMLILHFAQIRTPVGKSLNLIGANERTARISGIHVDRSKIFAFTVCGLTCSISGCLLAVKLQSSAPTVGNSFTLLAVAAVLLGGTSMTGGKGSVLKTLLGVLMVTMIENGMTIIGVDAFWSQIVFGALIIVAMFLTSNHQERNLVVK